MEPQEADRKPGRGGPGWCSKVKWEGEAPSPWKPFSSPLMPSLPRKQRVLFPCAWCSLFSAVFLGLIGNILAGRIKDNLDPCYNGVPSDPGEGEGLCALDAARADGRRRQRLRITLMTKARSCRRAGTPPSSRLIITRPTVSHLARHRVPHL